MIPTVSPIPNLSHTMKMQHSPVLPPFTPHSKIRSTSLNRGWSPLKHHRAPEHLPLVDQPAPAWKETPREDVYVDNLTLLSPTMHTDQNKSFQSTTVLRSVPIMRRHLDTFGGRTFSLPAKTKPVPFHTGRFIYDPSNRPIFFEELTQNQRLQAEVAMVEKVRGLKRKREALEHRWGWRKMDLFGFEMARGQRYSLQAEVQKLKELILPPTARDIYTGRGIRLPEYHHTKRAVKPPTHDEPPYPPPPSTTLDVIRPPHAVKPASPPPPRHQQQQSVSKTARSRDRVLLKQMAPQPHPSVDLLVQSVPVPGIAISPIPRNPPPQDRTNAFKSTLEYASEPQPEPTPVTKLHEPVEQIEFIEPQPTMAEDEDPDKLAKQASPVIADTPVDRSRSIAAPSVSPDAKTSFNPLISVSAIDDAIATEEEYTSFRKKYTQLDNEIQGQMTFEQVMTSCPSEITECQGKFLKCLYDLTCQNITFGPEEYVAMTSLAHRIVQLSMSTQAMFDQINFATLEESLHQYTELFSSVDRTGRGRIGVGALLQMLGTTLQRQLEPDTKLAQQIVETMQKEFTSDVPRLDFLCFIPYFLYLEEMT